MMVWEVRLSGRVQKGEAVQRSCRAEALPPELEREVFEICAVFRPVTIPKLMLVAHRVKEWVEPLLYRTICLGPKPPPGFPKFLMEIIMPAIRRKPSSFFETAVRHLMIDYYQDRDEVDKILDVCTGVQHLSIDVAEAPDSWLDRIVSFPLERLQLHSCESRALMRVLAPEHTLCRRLTHLEIRGFIADDAHAVCDALIALPHLSHLAFGDNQFVHSCPQLLESCKRLRALVCRALYDVEEIQTHRAVLERDARFVQFSWEFSQANEGVVDWYIGAQGGVDSWIQIERFIAKRRSREIDPLQYQIQ
ncbi:hypothetical protein K438DRAFT_1939125 [Mycena galopus ATCC 62051]|nr:hypothetical protein K438DRAFT_1939125 [Mycena galopus ATCC 62051]